MKKTEIVHMPVQTVFRASFEEFRQETPIDETDIGNTRNLVLGFLLNNGKRLDAKVIERDSCGFLLVATKRENARQAGFLLENDPPDVGRQETVDYTLKPDEITIHLNTSALVGVIVIREHP